MSAPRKNDARRQPGGVGKARKRRAQFSSSFGDGSPVKPHDPNEQAELVLRLIGERGPVLSLELTANRAIREAAARVHDLRALGWNVITVKNPGVIFWGVERRNVASYSLGSTEWVPPRGRGC